MKISLAAARVNANMSQSDVAKSLEVSEKTVANWENGITEPKTTQFFQMCELYRVSVDDIILPKVFS